MKYTYVLVLCFCLATLSCKTNEVHTPDEFKGNKIILSHGGGFTGVYTTYCLLDNGQLFKNDKNLKNAKDTAARIPIKSLKKATTEQIFSNYKVLGLGNEEVQSYGNLNYSITMVNDKGEEHKSIWGMDQKGAEKLQLFYNNIMNLIKLNNKVDASKSEVQ
jgi:hypothetical protein